VGREAGGAPRGAVLLVHGLRLPGGSLAVLARRLRRVGWRAEPFPWRSAREVLEEAGLRLAARLEALAAAGPVHVVAHSLGGLVADRALAGLGGPPRGRVVALGTPFLGSEAARRLLERPWGRRLLGVNGPALATGIACWRHAWPLHVVAGTRPLGWGRLLAGPLEGPHDGSVRVAETEVPGLASHETVVVSHLGLLWARPASRAVLRRLGAPGC